MSRLINLDCLSESLLQSEVGHSLNFFFIFEKMDFVTNAFVDYSIPPFKHTPHASS